MTDPTAATAEAIAPTGEPAPPEVEVLETEIDYERPWLYPKQTEAIFDPKRISCIEASTKAGKTVGCICWLIEQALLGPGGGRNYWWIAPVVNQSDIAFTRMVNFLPQGTFTAVRGNPKRIILLNGAIIWFKGADRPDTLYGDDVHAAVIDEASRLKESAWHAVRSTLTATRGPLRLIGNVRGRRNWFYQLARRAQSGNEPDLGYHKIIAYDAVQAGVLADDEIAAAKRQYPEQVFRELYLAEPSDDGGNPFGQEAIARCIGPLSTKPPRVWAWDLAKTLNWTVGIALDEARRVCRFERWHGVPWEEQIKRIVTLSGRTPTLIDSTGVGDPIVERLQNKLQYPHGRFEGFKFNPSSKQKIMEGLAVVIQSAGTTYPDGPIPYELDQFEFELTRTGVRFSAPEGMQDDCVCALALAHEHFVHAPKPMNISPNLLRRVALSGVQRH